jgi:3-hydroxypropionyl-coenzyme A dehydratase
MITAEEAEQIGLVNKVVSLTAEDENRLPEMTNAMPNTNNHYKEEKQQPGVSINKRLMDECFSFAKEITKNSFNAVKTSKMLINKGMDADINTGYA